MLILPDSPKPFQIRAFTCKLCGADFSEVQSATLCQAKTRWRQKIEQEERVVQTLTQAPSGQAQLILDTARKHMAKTPVRDVGPLEAAVEERASKPKSIDPNVAKLFEEPVLLTQPTVDPSDSEEKE
jgi:hypothetical protein